MFETILSNSSRAAADEAVALIGNKQELYDECFAMAQKQAYPFNMRAARVLALCVDTFPELAKPHLSEMIAELQTTKTDGIKRGYLKIVVIFIESLPETEQGVVIDLCFKIIERPSEAIAVKFYAIDILNKATGLFPELEREFLVVLEDLSEQLMMTNESPALRAVIRNTIKERNKKKRKA